MGRQGSASNIKEEIPVKFMNNKWLHSRPYRDAAGADGDGDGDTSGAEGNVDNGGDGDAGNGDAGVDGDTGTGNDDAGTDNQPFFASLPDDWRDQLAGEDKGRLNDLSRYTSLDKFIDSAFEAKTAIRKGETSNGLPDDPTDEQLAAWREANGVPATADDYKLDLGEGAEMSEMQQQVMTAVQKVAHEHNISNEALSALARANMAGQEAQFEAMQAQDGLDKMETEKLLRENWKGEYDMNFGAATALLNRLPENIRDEVLEGRTASGKALMNTPEFVQFLTDVALENNPGYTLPGGGENQYAAADEIIAKVQAIFDEGRQQKDYFRNPELQRQYQQAISIKESAKQK